MINSSIIITKYRDKILTALSLKGRIEAIELTDMDGEDNGSIFIGSVSKIIKNISGAFVDIAPSTTCFMQLEGIRSFHFVNKANDGSIKAGDELLVRFQKAAFEKKLPVVTGRLGLKGEALEDIVSRAATRKVYSCLYRANPPYIRFIEQYDNAERIVCDNSDVFSAVLGYIQEKSPERLSTLSFYEDDYPLFKLYKLESLFDELRGTKVWLPSGGNILVETTSAMTVIDVNTAKTTKGKNTSCFPDINREAGCEALRQMRLRNLSGIILIDFINDSRENTNELFEFMKRQSKAEADYYGIPVGVVDITGLGIMELTRKRTNPPLCCF